MKYFLPIVLVFVVVAGIFFSSKTFSIASHIVISEIKIGQSGATTDEFVELYNPTSSDVSLTGWKLTRKTSTNTEGNLIGSLSGTVPAFGFFLMTHTNSISSPSADLLFTSNSIAANNSVLLYDQAQSIVDKVGIGPGSTDPEASGTAALANDGKSIERKPGDSNPLAGNGEDTDNNLNDFVIRDVPQPQNSESEREPSIAPTETPSPTPTEEPTPTITPTIEPTTIPTNTPTPTTEVTPSETPPLTETPTPPSFDHFLFKWPFLNCEFGHRIIRVGFLTLRLPTFSCKVVK